ncbi:uncharacterized protein BDR25DRAFT_317103 [Lindgomyces ingoldianus]|uniref:Uncharacterized protein n=1 Tax=Lindgomyces ingoldianus TaxID=673940 RepID=A0ACB6QMJ0_9PLEO|nr:uncharacterized protein BDR25DRAFT_317103 [Lindgomyces ingoldianus]KAF2467361.1 hypothetical protein BDR25DRAFT_317103 [Lindgomyces ingoldianus]
MDAAPKRQMLRNDHPQELTRKHLRSGQEPEHHTPDDHILSKTIPDDSTQALLWARNKRESPFLRLPAEIRMEIYDLIFSGNTIKISRPRYKDGFKTTVWKLSNDPFKTIRSPKNLVKQRITLLNGVCRQLYKETAVLPYKMNVWAFDDSTILREFLVGMPAEQRKVILRQIRERQAADRQHGGELRVTC